MAECNLVNASVLDVSDRLERRLGSDQEGHSSLLQLTRSVLCAVESLLQLEDVA